jgi:hypothetical protein
MVTAQNGLCAICRNPPSGKKRHERLFIDHDHETGEIRGLLCHRCNLAIARFDRDPRLALKAYHYLQLHKR